MLVILGESRLPLPLGCGADQCAFASVVGRTTV